jgi:hypothetical protein
LGWLFKSKTHTSLKTNLIILLRPRIITTGVLAGNVIKDSLQKRRDFIEENLSGSDEVEKGILEIEDRVDEQIKHTGIEPLERYRNNEDIDEEPSKPLPTVEKPELLKPNEPKIEGSAKDS